ncbi:hypothetical protein [Saccharothrix syringae]|uniref:GUN4-like domain-containing protein n=1 Tax=Saccharothrix syringae TaxID=103733 RepID=A0A5Q0GR98_SACSY|nr:hypothetical protein [Saccharothrix syringae]QFZ16587.1 hypothetical protein EKG83_03080 [Saccharothrix syringae]
MSLVEHCVVGVDVEGFSARVARQQVLVQKELDRILDEASGAAGLPRARWERQPAGDGELAVLPAGVDLVALVSVFVAELERRLADHNEDHDAGTRIRLRVAMHTDVVTPGAFGYGGPGLVVLSRLLDSDVLRRALRDSPGESTALVLSEPLYRRAVLPELGGLRPRQFGRVRISLPGKDFHEDAYLRLRPGARPEPPPASTAGLLTDLVRSAPAPPVRRVVEPVARPAPAQPPLAPGVRDLVAAVGAALAEGDLVTADRCTTLALLGQAGRVGFLRRVDVAKLGDGLLAELDDAWAGASGGRWGFRAQRARLAGVVLSGRPFLQISMALGWREAGDVVPLYARFATRAGNGDTPFYPTLRNPDREAEPLWRDEWTSTVVAAHARLRDWEA